MTLEATPPAGSNNWKIRYRFENQRDAGWQQANVTDDEDVLAFELPIEQLAPLGIQGRLRVETRFRNDWQSE